MWKAMDDREPRPHNIALAKYGLDNQSSTSAKWQLWFGLDFFY
jgi:hypothetical protein